MITVVSFTMSPQVAVSTPDVFEAAAAVEKTKYDVSLTALRFCY